MSKIGIFYGSSTGNTEKIAALISNQFGDEAIALNVEDATAEDLEKFPYLIFGVSTWEIGEMQDDWDAFSPEVLKVNLKDKKVAIFGLGDQEAYGDSFVDGMGKIHDLIKDKTNVVGSWPLDGYEFIESDGVRDNKFVGLVLDEDNQKELTVERVKTWIDQLKAEFK